MASYEFVGCVGYVINTDTIFAEKNSHNEDLWF